MHDFTFFGGGWMMIFWVVLIILLVVVLISALTNKSTRNTGETPMEILEHRYARGDIDKEEFEERKKELLK